MSLLARALRTPTSAAAGSLLGWLRSLSSDHRRGDLAHLRRARSPEEALLSPALHELVVALESADVGRLREGTGLEEVALIGMIGAALGDRHRDGRLGDTLGRSLKGTSPPVSETRFRRLLTSETPRARAEVLRRLIQLTDGASFPELARAIVDWTPARRRQIAFDYYDAASIKENRT